VAALQQLPARQRAVLILREVLRWEASEVAELLTTSVASVNSALQRARATMAQSNLTTADPLPELSEADRAMLDRYVTAFERYDMAALTSLIREDATQSMPPYDMWLFGRDDILAWWVGPGNGCRGSRVVPARWRKRAVRLGAEGEYVACHALDDKVAVAMLLALGFSMAVGLFFGIYPARRAARLVM